MGVQIVILAKEELTAKESFGKDLKEVRKQASNRVEIVADTGQHSVVYSLRGRKAW
jgi:hypothetical protein